MITNFFIPELNNHDVQELWFQQDGSTCHTARATIDLLKDMFGDRLISRFGPVNWPPRSCDLTPQDYFLWGYVKSLVYADKSQTLDHLEDNIRRVIADIRPQMLKKVIENWTSRLDYIRASRGSHMPEIIFKIYATRTTFACVRRVQIRALLNHGRGSLVVKVTDSLPACHEFKPCTAVQRRPLNMPRLKRLSVGVVWKLEKGDVTAQVSSFSLDLVSKLESSSSISLSLYYSLTFLNTHSRIRRGDAVAKYSWSRSRCTCRIFGSRFGDPKRVRKVEFQFRCHSQQLSVKWMPMLHYTC
ncbi:DUF4817 domain-containing protein [Trichonephila clavipes]|nr:DUF4817 domain-containing protein [Trichonephila clavipes]